MFTARFSASVVPGGTGNLEPSAVAQLPPAVRTEVVQAFSDALNGVFLFAIPFALVAFVLSWFLPEVPLRSRAAPLDGVAEAFGMVRAGAAEVLEEAQARIRAARAALDRLDDLARRDGLTPYQAEPLRRLFEGRIAHLHAQARVVSDDAMSAQGWQLAEAVLRADREAQSLEVVGHRVDERIRHEVSARRAGARVALRRLDELAPTSGVPEEQVAALRALFQGRLARIGAVAQRARDRANARTSPEAFWRVAAELLAVERRTLATSGLRTAVAHRAEHDLDAERAELVGTAR